MIDKIGEGLLDKVVFDANGWLPAVAQDDTTGQVRMHAFMNAESLRKTLETGIVHYFSRSRNILWKKGETSGHFQHVKALHFNCTMNAVLVRIDQEGFACHTMRPACFFNSVDGTIDDAGSMGKWAKFDILRRLLERNFLRKEPIGLDGRGGGSDIHTLAGDGKGSIRKKPVGETEGAVSAGTQQGVPDAVTKAANRLRDLLTFMVSEGVSLDSVLSELEDKFEKVENLP